MVIDYDKNPALTEEQRLQSLKESVQMALDDVADKSAGQDKKASDFKAKTETALGDIQESIEQILDRLGEDFVTETGTSGIWSYRKWDSGIAECWGTYSASIAITTASPNYGGYRSLQQAPPNFPITFTTAPSITATSNTTGGYWVNNVLPSTTGLSFFLSAGGSMEAAVRPVAFHVIGKWK